MSREFVKIELKTTPGIQLSWHFDENGVIQIESNLSDEDTMAAMELAFSVWMMEGMDPTL